jgi:hypothetical protein
MKHKRWISSIVIRHILSLVIDTWAFIYHPMTGNLMITNADRIEKQEFGLVEDDEDGLQYSAHRHDYKMFENGNMIDGGRSYIRSSGCTVYRYVVRDGGMVREL